MHCPSCGAKDRQKQVGHIYQGKPLRDHEPVALLRCELCQFLYTAIPSPESRSSSEPKARTSAA